MISAIDINADLGELPGDAGRASDAVILDAVTSCAIACGGHAGDEAIMEATLLAAHERGVAAGAHPGYPDRENFGRVSMILTPDALHDTLCTQLQRLQAVAARLNIPLTHVKPHGALYNDAAISAPLASQLAHAIKSCFGTELALIGPPGQETEKAALDASLPFHAEGFIDRTYLPNGTLMPRSLPGAVLLDTSARVAQARQIVLQQRVSHSQGGTLDMTVKTLCLHGDSPQAGHTAHALKAALLADGIALRAAGAPHARA